MLGGDPARAASSGRERFSRALRLRRRADFLAVQNQGRRLAGAHLLLFAQAGPGRFGVTVSRKVGGAVARNRVKRWLRECFRRSARPRFPAGLDVVVVAKPSAAGAGYESICRELSSLAQRLGARR